VPKFIVTYSAEFIRSRAVSAKTQEEAQLKAERQERDKQETLRRSGYSLGDIDIIDVSRDAEVSSRWT
jgi:hypothetical protein